MLHWILSTPVLCVCCAIGVIHIIVSIAIIVNTGWPVYDDGDE